MNRMLCLPSRVSLVKQSVGSPAPSCRDSNSHSGDALGAPREGARRGEGPRSSRKASHGSRGAASSEGSWELVKMSLQGSRGA